MILILSSRHKPHKPVSSRATPVAVGSSAPGNDTEYSTMLSWFLRSVPGIGTENSTMLSWFLHSRRAHRTHCIRLRRGQHETAVSHRRSTASVWMCKHHSMFNWIRRTLRSPVRGKRSAPLWGSPDVYSGPLDLEPRQQRMSFRCSQVPVG